MSSTHRHLTALAASGELSIAQLRQFLLVAGLGSYTAAATRANRTQSALSLSIRQMERRLGQALFEPASRGTLTAFGAQCLPIARGLVEHYEGTVLTMHSLARGEEGRLTIASVGTGQRRLLSRHLPRFVAAFPLVRISLLDLDTANVERAVLTYEADIGLCGRSADVPAGLDFVHLFTQQLGVVCMRGHELASRKTIAWSELAKYPLIASPVHVPLLERPEAAPLRNCAYYASHLAPQLDMLRMGMGITVLGSEALPDGPDFRHVPLVRPRVESGFGLVKRTGRALSPPAAAMERLILAKR